MTHKSPGKDERDKTDSGRARLDVLRSYSGPRSAFNVEQQEFKIEVIRPDLADILPIGPLTETLEWVDDGGTGGDGSDGSSQSTSPDPNDTPVMTGTLTLRTPVERLDNPKIHKGHVVRLNVRTGPTAAFQPVWDMRIWKPSEVLETGSVTYALADDLMLLAKSKGHFDFRKKLAHEIARSLAAQFQFKLGSLSRGTVVIKSISDDNLSPLAIIKQAYEEEQKKTGRRFVMRWNLGKLDILEVLPTGIASKLASATTSAEVRRIARSFTGDADVTKLFMAQAPFILSVGPQMTNATIDREDNPRLATAVTVRGKARKSGSKKRSKVVYTHVATELVEKYGYIHAEVVDNNVDTTEEARKVAKRTLAHSALRKPTITFDHPGVYSTRRGDPFKILLDEDGFSGEDSLVWAKSVTHTLSGGSYTMSVEATSVDPLDAAGVQKEMDKIKRAEKKKRDDKAKAQ